MRLGICAGLGVWSHPPAGLDFIEANVQALLKPQADDDEFAPQRGEALSSPCPVLAANCFLPGSLPCTGPDVRTDDLDAYVQVALRRAGEVGLRTIVFGSGGSRRVPDGFDPAAATAQLADHLGRWGPMAAEEGVTLVVEPLQKSDCNIVTTVREGAELVRRVDHAGVRLLVDTFHMAADGDPAESIADAADLVAHVHVAELEGRGPPGIHGEDLRPYFRPLKQAGYDGAFSLECRWDNLPAQAEAALAELKRQIDDT